MSLKREPRPKPRKRVRDPGLLARYATFGSQIPWMDRAMLEGRTRDWVVTHHLVTNPKHDEEGNLFRLPDSIHKQFHDGPDKLDAASRIRRHMTDEQVAYVLRERGQAWLDRKYPEGAA